MTREEIIEKGATVIFQDTHVSGHACQEELKLIYSLVKPKYAIPVHGEFRHLKANAATAESLGIPKENIFIIHSGDVLELDQNGAAVVDRVQTGAILVDGLGVGDGYLILLGVGKQDREQQANKLWDKLSGLRIFNDKQGKTNLSLMDVKGEVLVVSQFTLYANCRRGRRPSFIEAGDPQEANRLYEYFCGLVERDLGHVEHGEFGADMKVELLNDGPFTIVLDTDDLEKTR